MMVSDRVSGMNWYQASSSVICLILVAGVLFRRDRRTHVLLMSISFIADTILGATLEFNRHVTDKALGTGGEPEPEGMLFFHIAVATISYLLYFPQIYLGRKLLGGDDALRRRHRLFAIAFIGFRLLNLTTSFQIDVS